VWTVSVGKPKGKGPFRKLKHRCKDRIRMDPGRDQIRRRGGGCRVNSVGSGQGPMMASCEYSHEPSGFGSTVTE
jgi:hypothetical protein